jgi:hypothetical protein
MYALLSKARKLHLPLNIQIQLFDALVKPILMYGSEVWGYQSLEAIEKVQRTFIKCVLHLNNSTTTCMVYGETGCFPLEVYVKARMVNFWGRLLTGPQNKISVVMYKLMRRSGDDLTQTFSWLSHVKMILNNCGMSNIWELESFPSQCWLKNSVLQRLKDQYIQTWSSQITESSKCLNYRIVKTSFHFEPYLLSLPYKLKNA